MLMASRFNENVAMDLKQWNGRWILHIIDMSSRYTLLIFVDRKKPCHIRDAVMKECMGWNVSCYNWIVKTTGIKPFLQGKEIKRDVYIKPRKGSKTAAEVLVWK